MLAGPPGMALVAHIGFRRVGAPLSEKERLSDALQSRACLESAGIRRTSLGPDCCVASPPACVSGAPNSKRLPRLVLRDMSLELPGSGHARWSRGLVLCAGSGPRQSLVCPFCRWALEVIVVLLGWAIVRSVWWAAGLCAGHPLVLAREGSGGGGGVRWSSRFEGFGHPPALKQHLHFKALGENGHRSVQYRWWDCQGWATRLGGAPVRRPRGYVLARSSGVVSWIGLRATPVGRELVARRARRQAAGRPWFVCLQAGGVFGISRPETRHSAGGWRAIGRPACQRLPWRLGFFGMQARQ